MNYEKTYNQLIVRAKSRKLTVEYKETHHIIPKCLGGSDQKENLAELTPEEHYLAHLLLVKMYPKDYRIICAAKMMATVDRKDLGRFNNKEYGWLRRKWIENHPMKRPEVLAKLRCTLSTEDYKNKKSKAMLGNTNKAGYIWISCGDFEMSIHKNDKIPEGFVLGRKESLQLGKDKSVDEVNSKRMQGNQLWRLRKDTKIECPHCSKQGARAPMTRHHFDNCKRKT